MVTIATTSRKVDSPLMRTLRRTFKDCRSPRLRTMREFAEAEIVIPDGPYEGLPFRCFRQPYTGLWFDAVDSGLWPRIVSTGPTQSGKTLLAWVCPLLYHLFEIGEKVIAGLPDMDMALDKWREDLEPVIARTAYRELLPTTGGGSRGGKTEALVFRNRATLRFMSGGGGDKSRSAYTARVLVITETDGMDVTGGESMEADKITQLIGRTRAFTEATGLAARIYMECTVTVKTGRTWRERKAGTESHIAIRCPRCRVFVTPEREHLKGWENADNEVQARKQACFVCPKCAKPWTDDDRLGANLDAVLLHRGQTVDRSGRVRGKLPQTQTLGFRWSAVNNLFATAGDVGADEFRASRATDEDNAEREMCQFVWAIPYQPPTIEVTPLDHAELCRRTSKHPRGFVPPECDVLVTHVDLGKRLGHYVVAGVTKTGARTHVVEYGVFEIASDALGVNPATLTALREFRDRCEAGWSAEGSPLQPRQVWVDAAYWESKDAVYQFCRESGDRYRPVFGRAEKQQYTKAYVRPKSTGSIVGFIGEEYHLSKLKSDRLIIVEVNADYWKTQAQERLRCPVDAPGAITFHAGLPNEHTKIAKHMMAEERIEEFDPIKGVVVSWKCIRRTNHHLDNMYNCLACAHFVGARLTEEQRRAPVAKPPERRVVTPDGRPYMITER